MQSRRNTGRITIGLGAIGAGVYALGPAAYGGAMAAHVGLAVCGVGAVLAWLGMTISAVIWVMLVVTWCLSAAQTGAAVLSPLLFALVATHMAVASTAIPTLHRHTMNQVARRWADGAGWALACLAVLYVVVHAGGTSVAAQAFDRRIGLLLVATYLCACVYAAAARLFVACRPLRRVGWAHTPVSVAGWGAAVAAMAGILFGVAAGNPVAGMALGGCCALPCFSIFTLHPSRSRAYGVAATTASVGSFRLASVLPIAVVSAALLLFSVSPAPGGRFLYSIAAVTLLLAVIRHVWDVRERRGLVAGVAAAPHDLPPCCLQDQLTGADSRRRFTTELETVLASAKPHDQGSLVAIVNIDNFAALNDRLGLRGADQVLVAMADRLRMLVPTARSVARLSGDEFGVIVPGRVTVDRLGETITAGVRQPFDIDHGRVHLTCSIGIAQLQESGYVGSAEGTVSPADVMQRADLAMYAVKQAGKDGFKVHGSGVSLGAGDDRRIMPQLRGALDCGDVRTVYQPIVAADTGRLLGFEALSRWTLEGKPVSPEVFIGAAARNGLLDELTYLVVERSCQQLREWNSLSGHQSLTVSVNIGGYTLRDRNVVAKLAAIAQRHGIQHHQLVLEVAENVPTEDLTMAVVRIEEARSAGFGVSLDDFGAGYNTIVQALRLPMDQVKLDRQIIAEMQSNPLRRNVVQAMCELAQHLRVNIVAEGVENEAQLLMLRQLHVDAFQGFLIGRPMPAYFWDEAILHGRRLLPMPRAVRGSQPLPLPHLPQHGAATLSTQPD